MGVNPNCATTFASLRLVGGSVDPSAITAVLGIEPTFQIGVGEVFPKGSRPRTEGIWAISTKGRLHSSDLQDHVEALLDMLMPDFMQHVPTGCRCEIQCTWFSATGHGGPSLPAHVLTRLGAFGIDLDFDFYSDV